MKKNIFLTIFCIGFVLSVQNLLITLETKNINVSTNNDSVSQPKTSTIIIEDSSEFSEGTLENLTISDDGYLMLEYYFPSQQNWKFMAKINQPSGRCSHSMAYNSKYDKVILFGGKDFTADNDETWAYDLDTNTWTKMAPSNHPSARQRHSMVYNSKHDKVILFGGNWGGPMVDDTWVYDLATDTWTEMNPSPKPSTRDYYSMAYDSKHDKVILFGGNDWGARVDDTWAYDLDTNMWTNMTPSTKPSARQRHSMVYNSEHDKVILFGGDDGARDDETWAYDLDTNTWTNMTRSTKPSERYKHSMVYDSKHDKVILFGGFDGNYDDETWVFRLYDYLQNGRFDSRITSLDGIHKFSGEISWFPENQTVGTNLTVQNGFSNTKNDEDFTYTSPENTSFTFEGVAHYFRYRVNFESTNDFAFSPMLENIMIDYVIKIESTQNIINIDESEGDNIFREDYLLEMILVSCLIGVGSVFAFITVLYKKKIDLLEKPTKLKSRELKSKRSEKI